MTPFKVDNYITEDPPKILGKGASAIVYMGYDTLTNMKVAIKIINKDNHLGNNRDEIMIMNYIKDNPHENIVRCYHVKEDYRYVYIVMEYCNSDTLFDLLTNMRNSNKFIQEKFIKYYFLQIINGMRYLYNNNIIHRDIKPKNILISDNNTIKIADFGMAKQNVRNQLLDTICGSPLFMAPEMIAAYIKNSTTQYDSGIDIWACGIVLYQMIYSNYNPYDLETGGIKNIHDKLENKNIEIPRSDIDIVLDNECINLLKRMLDKNSSSRITWPEIFAHTWTTTIDFLIADSNVDEIVPRTATTSNNIVIDNYINIDSIDNASINNNNTTCPNNIFDFDI